MPFCQDATDFLLIGTKGLISESTSKDVDESRARLDPRTADRNFGPHLRGRTHGRCGWARFYLADHLPHILLNPFHERMQRRLTALDSLQTGFPLTRHPRTLHLGMDVFNQPNALVSRLQ